MEIDTEPVYVKAVDINGIRGNVHNKLCISRDLDIFFKMFKFK